MIVHSTVDFDTTGKDSVKVKELIKRCTYANPQWAIARNMGFSVWNIPQTIQTFERDGRILRLSRGEIKKVRELFKEEPVDERGVEKEARFTYENNDFSLDEYQLRAIEAIASKRQGVIHATTSAGKTHIVLAAAARLQQKTLILVHRKILLKQFRDDIRKYCHQENGEPCEPGIIGGGDLSVGEHITIGMEQTFSKHPELFAEFGVVFMDECHLAPATTFQGILNRLPCLRRYGLSGTLIRKDNKQFLIYATFGSIIAEIKKEELLDKGRISPVHLHVHETNAVKRLEELVEELGDTTKAWAAARKFVHEDESRIEQIIGLAKRCSGKVLVLSGLVKPCLFLAASIERAGEKTGVITGRDAKGAEAAFEDIKRGTTRIVCATVGCVSTGVNIPDLNHIILIDPIFANDMLLGQIIGRVRRAAPGKTHGELHFMWDPGVYPATMLRKFHRTVDKYIDDESTISL